MRHGPNKLVFNTIAALQDIYRNNRLEKSKNYLVTQMSTHDNIFNVIDKDVHKHKRKIIGRCVSERSMREFEEVMISHVDILLQQLEESSGKEKATNMTVYCKRFGFDVVADLGFGESLHLQTDTRYRWMIRWLEVAHVRNNTHIQAPSMKWTCTDLPLLVILLIDDKFEKMIMGLINRRLERGKHSREDFFSLMLDSKNPTTGKETTIEEFIEEVLFFFPAGGDTASTALCALLFYLSRYPECYARVTEEVRSTFKCDAEIRSGPGLSSCQYLRACIDEALRLSPPVPGTLWRELASTDEAPIVIDGHTVPKGTLVGVNIYSIHHNAEYFPDPFEFRPERWLSGDMAPSEEAEPSAKAAHDGFTPFSGGARGCAGKAMAYMEISLVMAKLLLKFDFERAPGQDGGIGGGKAKGGLRARQDEFQLYDHFSSSHNGPNLVLKPRMQTV